MCENCLEEGGIGTQQVVDLVQPEVRGLQHGDDLLEILQHLLLRQVSLIEAEPTARPGHPRLPVGSGRSRAVPAARLAVRAAVSDGIQSVHLVPFVVEVPGAFIASYSAGSLDP